jgi:outer membrane protein
MNEGSTVARAALLALAVAAAVPAYALAQAPEARRITLEDALTLAARSNPTMVAAEGFVETAEAAKLEAMGAFLPSLSLQSAYSNSSNERFDQTTGRLVSTSYTAATQVGYDLFTAGRKLATYRSSQSRVASADAQLRSAQYQTALVTKSLFYDAAAATELLRVAERRLERARQQQSFAGVRLEVGTATRSDVLRAELEVGNAELAVIEATSALRTARLDLGRQVGIGEEVQPVEGSLPERPPVLGSPDSLAALAERTSPLAASAEAAEAAAHVERLASYSSYLPSLRLTGGYDWQASTYPPKDRSWSMRLTASLPVFNGFQREAAVARASAAERTADARARDARLAARAGAIDAAQQVDAAARRLEIAGRGVELAQEDLRVQEERYQIGVATIIELQTSQIALVEAEAAFVTAKQRLGVAVATLESVLGVRIESD